MINGERRAGYLASLTNVPPLIFRFQFNPETISEKKSFRYEEANSFGQWGFDQLAAAGNFAGMFSSFGKFFSVGFTSGAGLWSDIKEIGPLLVATKPLEAKGGDPRTISLDFILDARTPGPLDGDSHFGGSIEPDLAVLRAFMNPSWDVIQVGKLVASGFKDVPCWSRPPECSLSYGGLSLTCVMTDLNIKLTAFLDDGKPARAEVGVTLKEQTYSHSPLLDFGFRQYNVTRSLFREGIGQDFLEASGIQSVLDVFE